MGIQILYTRRPTFVIFPHFLFCCHWVKSSQTIRITRTRHRYINGNANYEFGIGDCSFVFDVEGKSIKTDLLAISDWATYGTS